MSRAAHVFASCFVISACATEYARPISAREDPSDPTAPASAGSISPFLYESPPVGEEAGGHGTGAPASSPGPGALSDGGSPPSTDAGPHSMHGGPADAGVIYTCPMHPEVQQPAPGRCPKCGMKLVPKGDGP